MKNLSTIACVGKNLELGYKNDLIWDIKEDLKYFKEKTWGHYVIMGRRTYESLPKTLPNRKYVILCNDAEIDNDDAIIFKELDELLKFVEITEEKFFVIGGGMIYKLMMPYVDNLLLTEVQGEFKEADTYFPEFDKNEWNKVWESAEKDNIDVKYKYVEYERK